MVGVVVVGGTVVGAVVAGVVVTGALLGGPVVAVVGSGAPDQVVATTTELGAKVEVTTWPGDTDPAEPPASLPEVPTGAGPAPVLGAGAREADRPVEPVSAGPDWANWTWGVRRGGWPTATPPSTSRPTAAEPDSRRAGRRCTTEVSTTLCDPCPNGGPGPPQERDKADRSAPSRPRILDRMDRPSVFELRCERRGDALSLWLSGDFDQAQRDAVIAALDEGDTPAQITIEMSQVGFMGSAGLSALIHACRMLQPQEGRVVLQDPAAPVVRLLDTCGLTHLFTIALS